MKVEGSLTAPSLGTGHSNSEIGDSAEPGMGSKNGSAPVTPRGDRIDARLAASSEARVAVQIPPNPQGDVYASEGHAAIWQAYYLQSQDGFASGRGPKPSQQMAYIVKRQLQSDFDAAGVPIHFRAIPQAADSPNAYVVTGRDASNSGVDVTIGRDGSSHLSAIELGREESALSERFRWHTERHDTGYLERLPDREKNKIWLPDNTGNVMTGRDV